MSAERKGLSSKGRKEDLTVNCPLGKRASADFAGAAAGREDTTLHRRSQGMLDRRRELRINFAAKVLHAGAQQNRTESPFDHRWVGAQHLQGIAASKSAPRPLRGLQ